MKQQLRNHRTKLLGLVMLFTVLGMGVNSASAGSISTQSFDAGFYDGLGVLEHSVSFVIYYSSSSPPPTYNTVYKPTKLKVEIQMMRLYEHYTGQFMYGKKFRVQTLFQHKDNYVYTSSNVGTYGNWANGQELWGPEEVCYYGFCYDMPKSYTFTFNLGYSSYDYRYPSLDHGIINIEYQFYVDGQVNSVILSSQTNFVNEMYSDNSPFVHTHF